MTVLAVSAPDIGLADYPCEVCGRYPSVGEVASESIEDGVETVTGYSVCEEHIPPGLEER